MKKDILLSMVFCIPVLSTYALDPGCYPNIKLDEKSKHILWVDAKSNSRGDGTKANPFRTINNALLIAGRESVVVIKAGIYREQLELYQPRHPVPKAIIAYPGETVVLNGMKKLTGWRPYRKNIYVTTIAFEPKRLFLGYNEQQLSRTPREGWWKSSNATTDELVCRQIKGMQLSIGSTQAYIWLQQGNTFSSTPISKIDPETCTIKLNIKSKWTRLKPRDKFYLQNNVSFIKAPGEWAYEKKGNIYKVFFYPVSEKDLKKVQVPFQPRALVFLNKVNGFMLAGIDTFGGLRDGIYAVNSKDVKIQWCRAFLNNRGGIGIRNCEDSEVTNCLAWCNNPNGISVSFSRNIKVAMNEVAFNDVDGILANWKTDGVVVEKNYVHHHLFWGHPDNIQTYRNLKNAKFIDNLLLAGGQSVMMEETIKTEFRGNMIVGCGAYMMICGHKNAGEYKISNNTLAFAGYGCFNYTWKDYDVHNNIIMTGHGGPLFGIKGIKGYKGRNNVLWNGEGIVKKTVFVSNHGWHHDFESGQKACGNETDSVYANPKFRNAPVLFNVINSHDLELCTREKLYLRNSTEGIAVGDNIELNFDGIKRKITAIDDVNAIVIFPALKQKPIKGWLVADWKDNDNFELDLRPAEGSPAINSKGEQVAGSRVNIKQYQNGDFTGDGERDIPKVPEALRKYTERFK